MLDNWNTYVICINFKRIPLHKSVLWGTYFNYKYSGRRIIIVAVVVVASFSENCVTLITATARFASYIVFGLVLRISSNVSSTILGG